jgi:hypothetical protein
MSGMTGLEESGGMVLPGHFLRKVPVLAFHAIGMDYLWLI